MGSGSDLCVCVLVVVFVCVRVPLLLLLDAVSSSHDPVGSNQRSTTSVSPFTVPLILQRDLETTEDNIHDTGRIRSWMHRWMS